MTGELLPLNAAAKRCGVSAATLRRRIAAGELEVYASAFNRSQRLIRLEDLTRYGEPSPIVRASSSDTRDQELVAG